MAEPPRAPFVLRAACMAAELREIGRAVEAAGYLHLAALIARRALYYEHLDDTPEAEEATT